MKVHLFLIFRIAALLAFFLSACGGQQAPATQAPEEPTTAPPTPEPATTQITIDGDASDWADYPVNMTDPAGDQQENFPDVVEAYYFKNDKYLYILIKVDSQGEWTKLGIHFVTVGGGEGQLSIYQPFRAVVRGEAGSDLLDIPLEFKEGETTIEIKLPLNQLPGEIKDIDVLGFAVNPDVDVSGVSLPDPANDVYGDIMNNSTLPLSTRDEVEP